MNQSLRNTAARLVYATDRLSKLMSGFESALQALNLGVEAWVALDGIGAFGYCRSGSGRWRLQVRSDESTRPIDECPRAWRVAVVPLLPLLLNELAAAAERLLTDTLSACDLANEMLSAIETVMASEAVDA